MACGDGEQLRSEECIAGAAGFLFDVACGERGRVEEEREAKLVCEMADEGFVLVRFEAAKFVVDVEDGGGPIELMKDVGEENGIGTT